MSFYQRWFPQRGRERADTVLAALDPSSWEFRAGASFCRPTLGCKHVAGAATDNPLRFSACTACVFFSGVSQISWSTPGVFLPLFSVTRRTARTLPLYEWVSRCCKACTLPHLLAFVACTIRTWSRRTLRWVACQSMAYHSAASRETAPTACAVVICFASYADLPSSLV